MVLLFTGDNLDNELREALGKAVRLGGITTADFSKLLVTSYSQTSSRTEDESQYNLFQIIPALSSAKPIG